MKTSLRPIVLTGSLGICGSKRVFMGIAPADLLCRISFADTLNEETGVGYQRKFVPSHSRDFRHYITQEGSTTIPLTFNLRPEFSELWSVKETSTGIGQLVIQSQRLEMQILAQVDCQHRLGCLRELGIPLAFMTFIGLPLREEMQIFNIINCKAKGLNPSLLDFHEAKLSADLAKQNPALYIALHLNSDPLSPWHNQLDLGGKRTIGLTRRASLRTMQKGVKKFFAASHIQKNQSTQFAYGVVLHFWKAIADLLRQEWDNPRKYFLTKGVGVYALMNLAGKMYSEDFAQSDTVDEDSFRNILSPFIAQIDWSNKGDLKGYGGEAGALEAFQFISAQRQRTKKARLLTSHV
jgi:DNA sulfur modification protein DndB